MDCAGTRCAEILELHVRPFLNMLGRGGTVAQLSWCDCPFMSMGGGCRAAPFPATWRRLESVCSRFQSWSRCDLPRCRLMLRSRLSQLELWLLSEPESSPGGAEAVLLRRSRPVWESVIFQRGRSRAVAPVAAGLGRAPTGAGGAVGVRSTNGVT